MIGNDVVDLALARKESNWQRRGFLDKIFTAKEQRYIFNAPSPETAVWHLWSGKEAAYKIVNRQNNTRVLIPLSLECLLEKNIVEHDGNQYFINSEITSDYIHTIAVAHADDFEKVIFVPSDRIVKKDGIPFYLGAPASVSHHGRFHENVAIYSPSFDLSFRKSKASV